jgi:two-component system response regulator RegA
MPVGHEREGRGLRVLAVDDDERVLAGYRRALERTCSVVTASNAETAEVVATETAPELAIIDLHLREGSSIDLIRKLRACCADLRIAVVSGYLTTDATVIAVKAGANIVLNKPIGPHEILRRLEEEKIDVDAKETPTLAEAVEAHIARVYHDCAGNVSETARRLGVYRSSLQRRLSKRGLKRLD